MLHQHRLAQVKTARLMTRPIEAGYERWRVSSAAECRSSIDQLREELGRRHEDPLGDPRGHPYEEAVPR